MKQIALGPKVALVLACMPKFGVVTPRCILQLTALACLVFSAICVHAAPPPAAIPGACEAGKAKRQFTVDVSGNASSTGRTYEGPLCVEVFFDPVLQFVEIEAVAAAPVKGPDLGSVILSGSATGGTDDLKPLDLTVINRHILPDNTYQINTLPEAADQLNQVADKLKADLDQLKKDYNVALQKENKAIDELTKMNKAMHTTNQDSVPAALRNQYKAIRLDLDSALRAPHDLTPTDAARPSGNVYLAEAQQLEDKLTDLPLEFVTGSVKPADTEHCYTAANANWTDWYAVCKDSVATPLKAKLDAILAEAQTLTTASDAMVAFKKQASIVGYWDGIFTNLGLVATMAGPDIDNAPLTGLYTHIDVPCEGLFNENVSTALSLVTLDYTPTLTGGDPTQKTQSAFVTVNCSTRFTIGAGVGFSTIEQKTFAIVPSSDGKGGTVNTFSTTSDSKITPVALAMTNIRLREWLNHGVGFYGSFGVGGDLQTNASAVYFLPGASFAFWRAMYLTLGAGIGSRSELTGGYKVGDTVPTGVTTIGAVTGSSHSAGFAFAITFTKP